ncbi:glutamine amidotransferase type 1 [Venturia nashicola]|uniref:Glutamine amidotransferase type 1 n=1 Tax=Venturia nashicola TaxID=86259 RepID=A0A4Z1PRK6_9PEZI|nr:glutamine amidotransferase type 1 [Venturia nashicola]TLD37809.1 glutamine amidotransferase type 1 [Venturia nashicola]
MAGLWILVPLIMIPLVLLLAWLVLSSCLGSSVRSRVSRSSIPGHQPSFGRNYAMGLSSGTGPGGWESIEMENMLNPEDEFDGSRR